MAATHQYHYCASAEKLTPTKLRDTTPKKGYQSGVKVIPTYRRTVKEGSEGNGLYDKLFFFRNKRVESYNTVIKRLKGK